MLDLSYTPSTFAFIGKIVLGATESEGDGYRLTMVEDDLLFETILRALDALVVS